MLKHDHMDYQTFLPLRDVPRFLERRGFKRPNGKQIHISTIHRWTSRGLNGRRLATMKVGRTRVTSTDDLIRFFEATGHINASVLGIPRQRTHALKRSSRDAREILGLPPEEGGAAK